MGQAKMYGQKKTGFDFSGLEKEYYVCAGENISAGSFVEFVNSLSGNATTVTSSDSYIRNVVNFGYYIKAYKIDEKRVLVLHGSSTYSDSGNQLRGMICEISDNQIIKYSDTLLCSDVASGSEFSCDFLSDKQIFVAHRSSTYTAGLFGFVCSISGNTITAGADTKIVTTTYTGHWGIQVVALNSTDVFVTHTYNSSNYYLYGIMCQVGLFDLSFSTGTDTAIVSNAAGSAMACSSCKLSNDRIFVAYKHGKATTNSFLYGVVCTIYSSLTITVNTKYSLSTSKTYTGYIISCSLISPNKVFIAHSYDTTYYLYGIVCDVSGGIVITAGYDTALMNTSYAAYHALSNTCVGTNRVAIVHSVGSSIETEYLSCTVCSVSGRTITLDYQNTIISTTYSSYKASALFVSGVLFVAHIYGSDYQLYGQCFSLDGVGKTVTNKFKIIKCFDSHVRPVTTELPQGIALTSGQSGDKIKVCVPYSTYNLVINGNFKNSITNWEINNSVVANASIYNSGDDEGCLIECVDLPYSSTYSTLIQQNINYIKNHVYYHRVHAKILECTSSSIRFSAANVFAVNLDNTIINEWQTKSYRSLLPNDRDEVVQMFGANNITSSSSLGAFKVLVNYIIAYDLTEMFGVGNEPQLQWCDENL